MDQDLDKGGHSFQKSRVYLGPSLGWADEFVQPARTLSGGGHFDIQPGDSMILVDTTATTPVAIQLPDVRVWVQQTNSLPATAFGRGLTIKDYTGAAATHNITVAPFGQQTIDNINQTIVISQSRAGVRLFPLLEQNGWVIDSVSVTGGGGAGGDVFQAGNNTFTGVNNFNSVINVPTVADADDSKSAATTEWVKNQGYVLPISLDAYAPLFSPAFTGTPTAPIVALNAADNSIATIGSVEAALAVYQPLDADLTALSNVTDTAAWFYRLGEGSWAKVVIGGGLNFSAGTLSSTAGGGNVSTSGVITIGYLARWASSNTIEAVDGTTLFAPIASPVFTGDPKAPTPATADNDTSIATTAYVKANLANYQPLDADLTALSGLGGTNTIYYRSAPDIWSPVTFSGMSFSGGVLTVTVGGGNVSNSGTPINGQLAQWTDATHVAGLDISTFRTNALFYGNTVFRNTVAATANGIDINSAAAGQVPVIAANGSDTNIAIRYYTKGAGSHIFYTNAGANLQVQIDTQVATGVMHFLGGDGNANIFMGGGAIGNKVGIQDANLVGSPIATTPSPSSDSSTKVATTAFVQGAITANLTTKVATHVKGLIGTFVNASTYTFSYTEATLRNVAGTSTTIGIAQTHTIDLVIAGANGRDTGTVIAGEWHFYTIWGSSVGFAGIASLAGPNVGPAFPSGYTHYCYLTTVIRDVTTLFTVTVKGNKVFYTANIAILSAGNSGGAWANVSTSAYIPAIATTIYGVHGGSATASGLATIYFNIGQVTGLPMYIEILELYGTANVFKVGAFILPNTSARLIWYVYSSATGALTGSAQYIYVTGYEVPNGD